MSFSHSIFKYSLPALLLVASSAWTSGAQALEEYPGVIRDTLGMTCTPQCTTCHTTEPGMQATAEQPFVGTLITLDFRVGNEDSLRSALEMLGDADTDEDGVIDTAELKNDPPTNVNDKNLNPQNPGDGVCAADILYGCGAHFARTPQSNTNAWAFGLASALALLWLARRRQVRVRDRSGPF